MHTYIECMGTGGTVQSDDNIRRSEEVKQVMYA